MRLLLFEANLASALYNEILVMRIMILITIYSTAI
jgi:hypothetical protein